MSVAARLKALAKKLAPIRDGLSHRDLRADFPRLLAAMNAIAAGPPAPPPTAEDRASWARADAELRERDPNAWRERQEILAKLRKLVGEEEPG